MNSLLDPIRSAMYLLTHPDAELISIVLRTLKISGAALLLSSAAGIPLGALVGLGRFRFKGIVVSVLNAFMGLPPVVAGLFIYILLSRSGPLGFMGLLYSPTAMVAAQFVLALPIVAGLSVAAVEGVRPSIRMAARTLGATPVQEVQAVISEARYGILSAVIAAFGRVMAEVGAILIVGGNIKGFTRVMTTTIAMETDKGDFTLALALGILLLLMGISINILLHSVQARGSFAFRGAGAR